jgi:hypothetical protein
MLSRTINRIARVKLTSQSLREKKLTRIVSPHATRNLSNLVSSHVKPSSSINPSKLLTYKYLTGSIFALSAITYFSPKAFCGDYNDDCGSSSDSDSDSGSGSEYESYNLNFQDERIWCKSCGHYHDICFCNDYHKCF